jgi:hypothetical protein
VPKNKLNKKKRNVIKYSKSRPVIYPKSLKGFDNIPGFMTQVLKQHVFQKTS